jgi:hypothetical protein
MRRLKANDERGAMAVIMAVLVSAVMMGLGYLVITVGGWFVARAMDQNAADAAAQAVASWCGTRLSAGQLCTQSEAEAVAAQYANGSANGDFAQWAQTVCGSLPGLTPCLPDLSATVADCPIIGPVGGYVDVRVTPKTDGLPVMTNFLKSGTQSVSACAQAGVTTIGTCIGCAGITISKCEWNLATANGTAFATNATIPTYLDTITARRSNAAYGIGPLNLYVLDGIYDPRNPSHGYTSSPPAPSNATIASSETVLYIHGGSTNNCPGTATPPGGFGWTAPSPGTTCTTAIADVTYLGAPGVSTNDCYALFAASRENRTPIYIPVYDSYVGTGSGVVYHLAGLAAFVVTGWDVGTGGSTWGTGPSSRKAASSIAQADSGLSPSDTTYCGKTYTGSSSDSCVYGYFTRALVPKGTFGPGLGVNLGLQSVSLTG